MEDKSTAYYIRQLGYLALMFLCFMIVAGFMTEIFGRIMPDGRVRLLLSSVVQAILGFIAAAWFATEKFHKSPLMFMGFTEHVTWRPFAGVLIVYFLALPMMNYLIDINQHISLPESMSDLEQSMRKMENAAADMTSVMLDVHSVWAMIVNVLVIGVLAGLAEETFFRGALQRMLAVTPGVRGVAAMWIAALIFSAAHMQFYGFVPRVLLGAFFGYMLYYTGSIWPGIFAHALNNSMIVVAEWSANNGVNLDFMNNAGIVSAGDMPYMALISLVLTVAFLTFCTRWFFRTRRYRSDSSVIK